MWRRDFPKIAEIAEEQGWDEDALLIHALGFIDAEDLHDDFVLHLEIVQREENEMVEEEDE